MRNVIIDEQNLFNIADEIRLKTGESNTTKYRPKEEMANAIHSILTPTDGSIPSKNSYTYTPTTQNQIISSGQYLAEDQIILGDSNLISSNIRVGVDIFGVTGDHSLNLSTKNITHNGHYLASVNNLDAYTEITTNIHPGLIQPYVYDMQTLHYIANGVWEVTGQTISCIDIYEVESGVSYIISLDKSVGTRFRVMFSEEDPSNTTERIVGKNIRNMNNPAPYESVIFNSTANGYLSIGKDNAGLAGLKSYVISIPKLIHENDTYIDETIPSGEP